MAVRTGATAPGHLWRPRLRIERAPLVKGRALVAWNLRRQRVCVPSALTSQPTFSAEDARAV